MLYLYIFISWCNIENVLFNGAEKWPITVFSLFYFPGFKRVKKKNIYAHSENVMSRTFFDSGCQNTREHALMCVCVWVRVNKINITVVLLKRLVLFPPNDWVWAVTQWPWSAFVPLGANILYPLALVFLIMVQRWPASTSTFCDSWFKSVSRLVESQNTRFPSYEVATHFYCISHQFQATKIKAPAPFFMFFFS